MIIAPKDDELIAIGISMAAGCKPCTKYHAAVARKARASDQEIKDALVTPVSVRKKGAEIIVSYALATLGDPKPHANESTLVALGAAFAVNCAER